MRALSRNTRRADSSYIWPPTGDCRILELAGDAPTDPPDNAAMGRAEAEDVPVQAQAAPNLTEAKCASSANKNYGEAQLVSVAQ